MKASTRLCVVLASLLAATAAAQDGSAAAGGSRLVSETGAGVAVPGNASATVSTPTTQTTPTNPTLAPTQALTKPATMTTPNTKAPTEENTKARERKIAAVVVSADESFLDFFVDPFEGDDTASVVFPPVVIAENAKVDKDWAEGRILVPEHLDFFAFDLWHGTRAKITPYFEQDIKVKATTLNPTAIPMVKLVVKQDVTTTVELELVCEADGKAQIAIDILRETAPTISFKVTKVCHVSNTKDLIISTRRGEVALHQGKVSSAFNVHDLRGDSFIASKEDGSDVFYFHTIHSRFQLVGRPTVEAFDAPPELLKVIAKKSPELAEVVREYASLSEEEKKDDAFYAADTEGGDDDDDDEDEDPYDNGVDRASTENTLPADRNIVAPTKIDEPTSKGNLKTPTVVCAPSLTGEVWRKTKRGNLNIVHRKEFGEKKLLGFAQAGVLGMHGGKPLVLNYNCIRDGLAIVILKFTVRPKEGQIAPAPEMVRMSWLKVCSAGQIAPDTIDLMGFNVHLGMYGVEEPSFYPVINGITSEPFTWDGLSLMAAPEEMSTAFYVKLSEVVEETREKEKNDELIRLLKVRIVSRDDQRNGMMNPMLSGHGAHGGIITSESLPIAVHYNCRKSGSARIGLDMLVDVVRQSEDGSIQAVGDAHKVHRISFYWRKVCAVTPITLLFGETIDPVLFEAGSAVEKAKRAKDSGMSKVYRRTQVIQAGKVSGLFGDLGTDEANLSKLYGVLPTQPTLAISLYKPRVRHARDDEQRDHVGLRFHEPILTTSNTNVQVSLRNIGEMETLFNMGRDDFIEEFGESALLSKQLNAMSHSIGKVIGNASAAKKNPMIMEDQFGAFEVARDDPVFLVVDHVCASSGDAIITLQLPVYGNTNDVVTIRWVKRCPWSETKLSAGQTGGAVVFFVILAILVTSAIFCAALRRQRDRISFLELTRKKDKNGYDKMDVVSSI